MLISFDFSSFIDLFFVIETDSYGHYFKHAITRYVSDHETDNVNQEFLIELEGTQSLRILCYESTKRLQNIERGEDLHSIDVEANERTAVFKGKASFDLTSSCLSPDYRTKELSILEVLLWILIQDEELSNYCFLFEQYSLSIEMSFVSWKSTMERIPPNKIYGTFGITVGQVCK